DADAVAADLDAAVDGGGAGGEVVGADGVGAATVADVEPVCAVAGVAVGADEKRTAGLVEGAGGVVTVGGDSQRTLVRDGVAVGEAAGVERAAGAEVDRALAAVLPDEHDPVRAGD